MSHQVHDILRELEPEMIRFRRELHTHAESGWTEFWSTAFVADILQKAGYHVMMGEDIIDGPSRMGLPDQQTLDQTARRAVEQGANPVHVELMKGGFTGVVADLRSGPPPAVALRFDLDSNTLNECRELDHRPFRDGFSSLNNGACHACGHDGNTSIGLGLALALARLKDSFKHNVRFIFQPAEEGVRGARPMVKAGVVDGIKAFVGCHVAFKALESGGLVLSANNFLATSKFDATFKGVSSHAGAYPEEGKNSLLAAATASLNLHAIPRHSKGATRITVGRLEAGEGRNIIPSTATICAETRGQTTELNDFMLEKSARIIEHSALMYDQEYDFKMVGGCKSAVCDQEMVAVLRRAAGKVPFFRPECIRDSAEFGASDDITEFITAVQAQGGIASYCMIGSEISAGHHNYRFDFNESVMAPAAEFLYHTLCILCDDMK